VKDQIIDLTAQIVSAHVAANDVLPDQLPALIRDVHEALSTVGQAPAEPVKAEPAVAANRSVFADHILCLDCGGNFKMLKAPPLDRPSNDAGRIPNQMGSATVIPDCGARICCGAIEAGLGQRLGTKGSGGAAAEEAWATEKGVTGSRGLSRRQRKLPGPPLDRDRRRSRKTGAFITWNGWNLGGAEDRARDHGFPACCLRWTQRRSLICALTRSYAEAHNGGADLAIRPSFFSTAMNSDQ
jgi:hypothetical protein